jgi:hypothetical protein
MLTAFGEADATVMPVNNSWVAVTEQVILIAPVPLAAPIVLPVTFTAPAETNMPVKMPGTAVKLDALAIEIFEITFPCIVLVVASPVNWMATIWLFGCVDV